MNGTLITTKNVRTIHTIISGSKAWCKVHVYLPCPYMDWGCWNIFGCWLNPACSRCIPCGIGDGTWGWGPAWPYECGPAWPCCVGFEGTSGRGADDDPGLAGTWQAQAHGVKPQVCRDKKHEASSYHLHEHWLWLVSPITTFKLYCYMLLFVSTVVNN